ncbi:MAG TPA: (Fe-S)-binding protein [Terriglobia bacterium]|nr:(Fe-S)-binding protein [Terriglobia bacterium]
MCSIWSAGPLPAPPANPSQPASRLGNFGRIWHNEFLMQEIGAASLEINHKSGYGAGEAPRWNDYSKCIHCGLCLNACPTYRELSLEMDSPRGRIFQMIQVEQGRLPLGEAFVKHIDLCLDCRACETACPSGVEYGKLVEAARGQIEQHYKRPLGARLLRDLFFYRILPHRNRLDRAGKLLRLVQRLGLDRAAMASGLLKCFPGRLAQVARLSPRMERPFFTERLGTVVPSVGPRKYRVAFFAGCIANLSFARLNDATVRVLARNGCEVVIPKDQGCCGALHVHAGIRDLARKLARQNIRTFFPDAGKNGEGFDAIITNAAGCGSVLKEYPVLFEEEEKENLEAAQKFSAIFKDVTEFLAAIEFNRDFAEMNLRATYQDPCHLLHAQRVKSAPRKLLAAVPGLELIELKEVEVCCGSAGIYNVAHNEMAEKLLAGKMRQIDATGAEVILTANPGCLLQLRAGVVQSGEKGRQRKVMHVVELLDMAYSRK